jgi:hypothetical protein
MDEKQAPSISAGLDTRIPSYSFTVQIDDIEATITRDLAGLGNPLDHSSKQVLIACATALGGTLPWNPATDQYDEATMTFFLPDGRAPTACCTVTVKPSPGLPKVDGYFGAFLSAIAGPAETPVVPVILDGPGVQDALVDTGCCHEIVWPNCLVQGPAAQTEFMVRFDGLTTSRLADGQIVTHQKLRCRRVLGGFLNCLLQLISLDAGGG